MKNRPAGSPEMKNLVLALVLATATMVGWQYFYERPRMEKMPPAAQAMPLKTAPAVAHEEIAAKEPKATKAAPTIEVRSDRLHGSISLRGARFDNLTLAQYRETIKKKSPEVTLLSPMGSELPYFLETGLLADKGVKAPGANTLWTADRTVLTEKEPVTLSWSNGQGLTFEKKIALDDAYMFTITTTVKNSGGEAVTLYPYGLISRAYDDNKKHVYFMHEGPLGVANNVLNDVSYKELREDGDKKFEQSTGWIGMTDKYWLTAIIPSPDAAFDTRYSHQPKDGAHDHYQVDMRGAALEVPANGEATSSVHVFAGAKEVKLLDAYRLQYSIPLFDRAVDFGSLYFLTKPIFHVLSYFHSLVGNFGIAILMLTLCIKTLLFPLASKSMTAMAQMKQLTPKMQELRERHGHDKMKMNQEMMALYKRESVNPMSGCLPLLLQIPVFFALYRVLYTTLEMRHAPFFGWIKDLSSPDPTSIINLFGLLPFDVSNLPNFLHIGIWPIIMCVTMILQQRLNPKPADEVQAAVMQYMPFIFLFMFAGFPAGLVIYWAWNNTLTILQQLYINSRLKKKGLK